MALTDDIRLLSKVPLFQDLGDDQLRLIAFGAERRHVPGGQILFREKSPAECAFVVAAGGFELSILGRNGKPKVEATATPGTMLSELALVTLVERKYTAVAIEDSEVLRITRALFQRLMEEYPAVAAVIQERIRDNIATMIGDLSSMQRQFV